MNAPYIMPKTPRNNARQLRKLDFDLANYFSNTIIPQLLVDADLILRIFTPPAMKQFSLSYDHVGSSIHDIKDNIRYPTFVENIEEVIATGENLEKEIQTTDGLWYQMNIVPYIEHEEEITNGVIITFIDITKRLNAIKELEKLNAQHETLMFALSHDIRQPISAITLLAETLTQAYKNHDLQQFDKWIKNLRQFSKGLASLVDDFITDNGNMSKEEPRELRLNIQEICADVLTALKYEIKLHRIEVIKNFQTSEIIFPKNSLRSVVYNLVHNAIKYRDPDKTARIEISTEKVERFVVLCVQDNGPGIAEKDQARIFEKSLRIREDVQGTGMGLYVAKRMIEAHGGRITLESKPGEGTTFKVFFKSEFSPKKH
ncbi:sensor histidine kinase [Salinimicrobium xinjiangense]|uniref:sensor histidine kinase n=1 Tax=Salinimicrobium xinjiangense TaxID=438596 RepID=UPI000409F677|nr:ATP-binding protein [Salinimicrobium xinjiangense]